MATFLGHSVHNSNSLTCTLLNSLRTHINGDTLQRAKNTFRHIELLSLQKCVMPELDCAHAGVYLDFLTGRGDLHSLRGGHVQGLF